LLQQDRRNLWVTLIKRSAALNSKIEGKTKELQALSEEHALLHQIITHLAQEEHVALTDAEFSLS